MDQYRQKKLSEIAKEEFLPCESVSLRGRLQNMIQYAVGRHDWYEDQRGKLFQASLAMLSFIAAAAAFISTIGSSGENDLPKILFYSGFLILGYASCRIIYLYTEVSEKNHPYRKVSDIKSWYFKYSISDKLNSDDIDKIFHYIDREKVLDEVRDDFRRFLSRFSRDFFEKDYIYDDIQQLYILYVLQNYRQKNLKKMYTVVRRWVVLSSVMIGLAIISLIYSPASKIFEHVRLYVKIGS